MVGLGRFELPTSRLSGVRSNQLSYRPSSMRTGWFQTGPPAAVFDCQRATAKAGALKTEQDRDKTTTADSIDLGYVSFATSF
jgi:hypothetical protein